MFVLCVSLFPTRGGRTQDLKPEYKLENDDEVDRFDNLFLLVYIFILVYLISFLIQLKQSFNPLTTNVPHHIETSQLICNPNQLTGFCMMVNIGR